MKKKFLIIIFALLATTAVFAQSNTTLSYAIGFGTGDLGDFIGKPSFRGIALDYRYRIQPNLALGATFGWSTFYEEVASDTYTLGNESLTGKQYRYSNNIPMLATVTYFLSPDENINPFGTLGVGTMYTRRNTDMNLYTLEQEAWIFLLQPEVGVQIGVADNAGLSLSLKYNVGFQAGDLPENQSYLSLNVGFAFF